MQPLQSLALRPAEFSCGRIGREPKKGPSRPAVQLNTVASAQRFAPSVPDPRSLTMSEEPSLPAKLFPSWLQQVGNGGGNWKCDWLLKCSHLDISTHCSCLDTSTHCSHLDTSTHCSHFHQSSEVSSMTGRRQEPGPVGGRDTPSTWILESGR